MSHKAVESILDLIRGLAPRDRVMLADEVDRLTWRDRMRDLLDRVQDRAGQADPLDDEQIHAIVDEIRSETPLYERYWIRRRRSAP